MVVFHVSFWSFVQLPTGSAPVMVTFSPGAAEERRGRKEDIVVHEQGSVIDLDEEVLQGVFIEQVARYARSLSHPVEPQSHD